MARTETVTRTLYAYSELSDKAKERAYEKWLNSGPEYFWAHENAESLKEFERHFPVNVSNFEYGYRDSIDWKFTGSDEIENLSGVRLRTYILNNYGGTLFEAKTYRIRPYSATEKKRRSRIFKTETGCPFTGYTMDESLLQPIRQFIQKPDSRTFHDLMGDCLDSWLSDCSADVEFQQSEENFADNCESNAWEFDANGNMA